MFSHLVSSAIMQRNAAEITVACLLLCLTFNYTFPMRRVDTRWSPGSYHNHTKVCGGFQFQTDEIKRSKKVLINTEDSKRKIKQVSKNTNLDLDLTNTGKQSVEKNSLSESDFRQYEQLVIMKKYPYLDLKELELKFSPTYGKNVRHNVKYNEGSEFGGDPGLCEPMEDGPNVEIINRGLSGFAIPNKMSKVTNIPETNLKLNTEKPDADVLRSLKLNKPEYP